jgi:hypothetical protein
MTTTRRRRSVRTRLLPFTGLVPVVLMVPVLAFDLYGLAIVLALVSGLAVVAFHLRRGQGVTSLDLLLLGFAALNAVLYLGLDSTVLLDHLDAVVYSLLTLQAASSLRPGAEPWTTQFTRRVMAPEAWSRPEFVDMNRFSTGLWVACFASCTALALAAGDPLRLYLPIALMVAVAVASRRLAREYLARLLGVAPDALPAPFDAAG